MMGAYMRSKMVDLSANVGVLRRWSHSRPGEPLPSNFASWEAANSTDALQLQRQDPELVCLLNGTAPASLLADALQGQLSPIPVSETERASDARKAEAQSLYDQSKTEEGLTLTQKIRLQSAFPELADKIHRESPTPVVHPKDFARRALQAQQQEREVRLESRARSMAATRHHF